MRLGIALIVIACISVGTDKTKGMIRTTQSLAFGYAKTAAAYIDGDRIAHYERTRKKDAYYQRVQAYLDAVQRQSDIVQYYYVFVPREDDFVFIWDANTIGYGSELGDSGQYIEGDRETLSGSFCTNPVERLYFSRYNTIEYLMTAFYPVFNSRGEPVALVGMDLSVPRFYQTLGTSLLGVTKCILVVFVLFMILAFHVFSRKMVRPIAQLKQGMQIYRRTMDSAAAANALEDMPLDNELGALLGDFLVLMVNIDDNTAEVAKLSAQQERIGTELKVATHIQADLLPREFPAFPERKEFDLYASMDPAREVGGDFYDFFLIDEDHLCMVMADVSGKGVPAALFMMIARTLINHRSKMGGSPSEILTSVNNRLCEENKSGMFLTVWLAILELATGKGVSVNAGHEHPVLRRAGGSYELVEYRHSPAVAFLKGVPFRERSFRLFPGDRLFVYTDGVPEATNTVPELYGTGRMLEALNAAGEAAPDETLKALKASILAFTGEAEQFDDITMLCLDYFGPEHPGASSQGG